MATSGKQTLNLHVLVRVYTHICMLNVAIHVRNVYTYVSMHLCMHTKQMSYPCRGTYEKYIGFQPVNGISEVNHPNFLERSVFTCRVAVCSGAEGDSQGEHTCEISA